MLAVYRPHHGTLLKNQLENHTVTTETLWTVLWMELKHQEPTYQFAVTLFVWFLIQVSTVKTLCITLYFIFTDRNNWNLWRTVSEPGLFLRPVYVPDWASELLCKWIHSIRLPGMNDSHPDNIVVRAHFTFSKHFIILHTFSMCMPFIPLFCHHLI